MRGFVTIAADVGSISTSYVTLTLSANAGDAKSSSLPASGYLDTLEFVFDETAATAAQIHLYLSWDANGDNPITGKVVVKAASGGNPNGFGRGKTTATLIVGAVSLDRQYVFPAGVTPGTVYLHVATDAGTVEAQQGKIRLIWADSRGER